jgi:PIN domain nuclease of toxin-antitoxin system
VIVLDTHVWIWWVHNDPLLPKDAAQVVTAYESIGLESARFPAGRLQSWSSTTA